MIRLVLDPGVLVSALITPTGSPAALLRAAREGRVDLIVRPRLLAEPAAVLARDKFRRPYVARDEAEEYVEGLALLAEAVADVEDPPRVSRDPNDDYLVAVARATRATAIVSGDSDLLALDSPEMSVVTPAEAIALVDERA